MLRAWARPLRAAASATTREWNGRREITEKTFKFDGKTVPSLFALVVLFPGFIYMVMKDELKKKYEKAGLNTKKGGERDQM